jgi:hypothetical protein
MYALILGKHYGLNQYVIDFASLQTMDCLRACQRPPRDFPSRTISFAFVGSLRTSCMIIKLGRSTLLV